MGLKSLSLTFFSVVDWAPNPSYSYPSFTGNYLHTKTSICTFHWKSAIAPCCCLDPPLTELELWDHRDRWMQLICRRRITRALPKSLLCKTHYVFLPCKTAQYTFEIVNSNNHPERRCGVPWKRSQANIWSPCWKLFSVTLLYPPPVCATRLSVGQKLRRVSDKRFLEFLSGPVKAVSVNKFVTWPSCSLLRKYFYRTRVRSLGMLVSD